MNGTSPPTDLKTALPESGLTLTTGDSMDEAAQKVVKAVDAK